MHPILFRLPLPHEFRLWWGLVAAGAIALVVALLSFRKGQRNTALGALVSALAVGVGAFLFRAKVWELPANLPIYSYGVMLGISLVIGWYLTLSLAERDGLPKEIMANCYVITAIAAIVGARVLYIVTNLGPNEEGVVEFKEFTDIFALRKGGLVAYGGFIGGFLGSWAYLSSKKIRLMPWADAAVPSLATGLLVTRIGCYLFGCDFGKRLPETAPSWLQKLGTFPKWDETMIDTGNGGAPAFQQQLSLATKQNDAHTLDILNSTNHSLPVHPTQIYESLVGLFLFALLMWSRRHVKFRGQIFFVFAFAYGLIRFLLEIVRDDPERGSIPPRLPQHTFIPICLALFAIAFAYGPSLGIKNVRARLVARILAFIAPIGMYFVLRPASYANATPMQLSTSQLIGLLSACTVAFFYARFWNEAQRTPQLAMSLGEGAVVKDPAKEKEKEEAEREDEDEDDEESSVESRKPMTSDTDETRIETPAAKKKKKKKAKSDKAESAQGDKAAASEEEAAEPEVR